MDELTQFIQGHRDARELKRALAVQMVQQDYRYAQIQALLQVSVGFISKWKQRFEAQGVSGLHLGYRGSTGYLDLSERQAVIDWLKQKNYWNLVELQQHIEASYGVVFASKQSYYDLFEAAGISWKKSQKCNPKKDMALVEKKTRDY